MNDCLPETTARFRASLEAIADRPLAAFGVAVSGGPDSLALLLLAAAAYPGKVAAATVDHRLRPGSDAEAAFVAATCAGLNVPHETLAPDAPPDRNLQSAARALRYRLLAAWARDRGLDAVLTAHHRDDQAETLLMRLQRGTGLAGLAGIRARTELAGAPVLRPLLGWTRAELAAIVAGRGLVPVDDPGNADPRFHRARLRTQLAETAWLDPAPLARSATALAEAEEALAWAAARLCDERITYSGRGAALDPAGLPPELKRRLLLRVLGAPAPRGDAVRRLIAALEAGEIATLAGWRCEGGRVWRFAPAPPRRA